MFDADQFLSTLTSAPGVYQMLDQQDKIIYVGKAKNLKKRISSYFRVHLEQNKTAVMVKQIAQIKIIITQDENEALLLENNLIKHYRPRYNILFKDDKTYPYLIFSSSPYPRLDLIRSRKTPRGNYFGPFSNSYAVRQTLQLIEKLFLLRNCSDSFFSHRTRPCLQYQIKRCSAPCVGFISPEDYQKSVQLAQLFLQGKNQPIIAMLTQNMTKAAEQLDFETAAKYRNQIQMLRHVDAKQTIQNARGDFDVIATYAQQELISVQLLQVRQGKIIGDYNYVNQNALQLAPDEALNYFIAQYYLTEQRSIPKYIYLPQKITDQTSLTQALSQQATYKVSLKTATRGIPFNLINMAKHNAQQTLVTHLATHSSVKNRFIALAQLLTVPVESLKRIECFDISHTFGEAAVASCVVFDQNGPNKQQYRIFNMQHITAGDDFAAMHQVLSRRFNQAKNNDAPLPDLVLIDGGKGQLQQAIEVMAANGLNHIILLGIAKGVTRKAGLETLWRAGCSSPLSFDPHSPAIHLLQHIRDEAHRFAISRHRQKRGKNKKSSTLEAIAGIGSKKRQALLNYFGGLQGLKNANLNAISKVPGIGPKLAEEIQKKLLNFQITPHNE